MFIYNCTYLILLIGNNLDGSGSEYSDEHDRDDNTDDEHDAFFDTYEILSASSIRSNGSSDHLRSIQEFESEETSSSTVKCDPKSPTGSNYPYIERRKKLPDPVEKETGVSLWSIIKDNIGKDLTKVCLPVYFNEPISSLQKCFEDLEYSHLLDQAYECGKMVSYSIYLVYILFKYVIENCCDKISNILHRVTI